jgi:hypothetical protein
MKIATKQPGSNRLANIEMWSGNTEVLWKDADGGSETKLTCAKMTTKMG